MHEKQRFQYQRYQGWNFSTIGRLFGWVLLALLIAACPEQEDATVNYSSNTWTEDSDFTAGSYNDKNPYWPLDSSVPTQRRYLVDKANFTLGAVLGFDGSNESETLTFDGYHMQMSSIYGRPVGEVYGLYFNEDELGVNPATSFLVEPNPSGFDSAYLFYTEDGEGSKVGYLVTNETSTPNYFLDTTLYTYGYGWETNQPAGPISRSGYMPVFTHRTNVGLPETIVAPLSLVLPPPVTTRTAMATWYNGDNPFWPDDEPIPTRRRYVMDENSGVILGTIEASNASGISLLTRAGFRTYLNLNSGKLTNFKLQSTGGEGFYNPVSNETIYIPISHVDQFWTNRYLVYMEDGSIMGGSGTPWAFVVTNKSGDPIAKPTYDVFIESTGQGWNNVSDDPNPIQTNAAEVIVTDEPQFNTDIQSPPTTKQTGVNGMLPAFSSREEAGMPPSWDETALVISNPPPVVLNNPGAGLSYAQNPYWPTSSAVPTRRRRLIGSDGAVIGSINSINDTEGSMILGSLYGFYFSMNTNSGIITNHLYSKGGEGVYDPYVNDVAYAAKDMVDYYAGLDPQLMYLEDGGGKGYVVTNKLGDSYTSFTAYQESKGAGWDNITAGLSVQGYLPKLTSRLEAGIPAQMTTPFSIALPPSVSHDTPGGGYASAVNPYWPLTAQYPDRRRYLFNGDGTVVMTLSYVDEATGILYGITHYGYQIAVNTNTTITRNLVSSLKYVEMGEARYDPIVNDFAYMDEASLANNEQTLLAYAELVWTPDPALSSTLRTNGFVVTNASSVQPVSVTPTQESTGGEWQTIASPTALDAFLPAHSGRIEAGFSTTLAPPFSIQNPPAGDYTNTGRGTSLGLANPYWPSSSAVPTRRRRLVDKNGAIVGAVTYDLSNSMYLINSRYGYQGVYNVTGNGYFSNSIYSTGGEAIYDPLVNTANFYAADELSDFKEGLDGVFMEDNGPEPGGGTSTGTKAYVLPSNTSAQTFTTVTHHYDGTGGYDVLNPVQNNKSGYLPVISSRTEAGIPTGLQGPYSLLLPPEPDYSTLGGGISGAVNPDWPANSSQPTTRRWAEDANGVIIGTFNAKNGDYWNLKTKYGYNIYLYTTAPSGTTILSNAVYSSGGEALYDPVVNTALYMSKSDLEAIFGAGNIFLSYMEVGGDRSQGNTSAQSVVMTNSNLSQNKVYNNITRKSVGNGWTTITSTSVDGYLPQFTSRVEAGIPAQLQKPFSIVYPPARTFDTFGSGISDATNPYWPTTEPVPTRRRYLRDKNTGVVFGAVVDIDDPKDFIHIMTLYGYNMVINTNTSDITNTINLLASGPDENYYDQDANTTVYIENLPTAPSGSQITQYLAFFEDGNDMSSDQPSPYERFYITTNRADTQTKTSFTASYVDSGTGWTSQTSSAKTGFLLKETSLYESGITVDFPSAGNFEVVLPPAVSYTTFGGGLANSSNTYWFFVTEQPTGLPQRRRVFMDKDSTPMGAILAVDDATDTLLVETYRGYRMLIKTNATSWVLLSSLYSTGGEAKYDPVQNENTYLSDTDYGGLYGGDPSFIYMEDGAGRAYVSSNKATDNKKSYTATEQSTGTGWTTLGTPSSGNGYLPQLTSLYEAGVTTAVDYSGFQIQNPTPQTYSTIGAGLANTTNPYWPATETYPTRRRYLVDAASQIVGTIQNISGNNYSLMSHYGFRVQMDITTAKFYSTLVSAPTNETYFDTYTNDFAYMLKTDIDTLFGGDPYLVFMEDNDIAYVSTNKTGDTAPSLTRSYEYLTGATGWTAGSGATVNGYLPQFTSRTEAGFANTYTLPFTITEPVPPSRTTPGHGIATNPSWPNTSDTPTIRRYVQDGSGQTLGSVEYGDATNTSGYITIMSKYGYLVMMDTNAGTISNAMYSTSTSSEASYDPVVNTVVYIDDNDMPDIPFVTIHQDRTNATYMENSSGQYFLISNQQSEIPAELANFTSAYISTGGAWSASDGSTRTGLLPTYTSRVEAGLPEIITAGKLTMYEPVYTPLNTPGHGLANTGAGKNPYWTSGAVPTARRYLTDSQGQVLGAITDEDDPQEKYTLRTFFNFETIVDINLDAWLGESAYPTTGGGGIYMTGTTPESLYNYQQNEGIYTIPSLLGGSDGSSVPVYYRMDSKHAYVYTNRTAADVNHSSEPGWVYDGTGWVYSASLNKTAPVDTFLTSPVEAGIAASPLAPYTVMYPAAPIRTPGGSYGLNNPSWPSSGTLIAPMVIDSTGMNIGTLLVQTTTNTMFETQYGITVTLNNTTGVVVSSLYSTDTEGRFNPTAGSAESVRMVRSPAFDIAPEVEAIYMEVGDANEGDLGYVGVESATTNTLNNALYEAQGAGWVKLASAQSVTNTIVPTTSSRLEVGLAPVINLPLQISYPTVWAPANNRPAHATNPDWPSTATYPQNVLTVFNSYNEVLGSLVEDNVAGNFLVIRTKYGYTIKVDKTTGKPINDVYSASSAEIYDYGQNTAVSVPKSYVDAVASYPDLIYVQVNNTIDSVTRSWVVTNTPIDPGPAQPPMTGAPYFLTSTGTDWTTTGSIQNADAYLVQPFSRSQIGVPDAAPADVIVDPGPGGFYTQDMTGISIYQGDPTSYSEPVFLAEAPAHMANVWTDPVDTYLDKLHGDKPSADQTEFTDNFLVLDILSEWEYQGEEKDPSVVERFIAFLRLELRKNLVQTWIATILDREPDQLTLSMR